MQTLTCHHCQQAWQFEPPLARSEECPHCQREARVCRNCEHFAAGAPRDCREPLAGWVRDKERSNFCGYFQAQAKAALDQGGSSAAKSQLLALFKDSPESEAPKLSLETLFKK